MDVNEYEERREEKRQRFLDRAEKARGERDQRRKQVDTMSGMMNGQPILIGHHSEKRHRRDLERMSQNIRKSVEENEKAEHYDRKAAGVGTGGISSDDPEAVVKLKEKLEGMEAQREEMKRINKQYKKGGWDAVEGISDEARARFTRTMESTPWEKGVYPGWALTNLGANIRRVKQRIEELSRAANTPEREEIKGEGYTIRDDKDENRVCFEFDAKPPREVCKMMSAHGFKWNKRLVAWTRHLNSSGHYAAEQAAKKYEEMRAN